MVLLKCILGGYFPIFSEISVGSKFRRRRKEEQKQKRKGKKTSKQKKSALKVQLGREHEQHNGRILYKVFSCSSDSPNWDLQAVTKTAERFCKDPAFAILLLVFSSKLLELNFLLVSSSRQKTKQNCSNIVLACLLLFLYFSTWTQGKVFKRIETGDQRLGSLVLATNWEARKIKSMSPSFFGFLY